jgi:hypothetical protein
LANSLSQMLQFPVVTADRRKPAIRGLLFDDQSWCIRYVVANVGGSFSPRLVAVPVASLKIPHWSRQIVETNLTLDELSCGLPAETVRLVSRQRQLAWNRHFGWRERETYSDSSFPPDLPRQEFREADGTDDPHLRSTKDLISYQVWDSDECLGLLEDFFVDNQSWHIGYLLVRERNMIHHERFLPSSSVVAISWGRGRVDVACVAQTA